MGRGHPSGGFGGGRVSTFTAADILREIHALAAERPDFVYENPADSGKCLYAHRDTETGELSPGCIVGAALHKLGVPLETLRSFGSRPAVALCINELGLARSGALDRICDVQRRQDSGMPWGEAVAL